MTQIFFIADNIDAVHAALRSVQGHSMHGWTADGTTQCVGVVECTGDTELVACALEAAGISLLPDHKGSEVIAPAHHNRLKQHGVLPTDTTKVAMAKVHGVSGFSPLKPKRY